VAEGGKCVRVRGWLPVLILPVIGWFASRHLLPAWGFMWVMCFTLYAGCKWLTLHDALLRSPAVPAAHRAAYLLAWPGMDPAAFLHGCVPAMHPSRREWAWATGKLGLGLILTWGLAGRLMAERPGLAGWTGMVGLIYVLHFGIFHLLSIVWRRIGFRAEPLMRNPLFATSLADFWGRRWNAAFHELVHRYTFRPLLRPIGAAGATMVVFLLSGLIHEAVISLPAHGGYGGPTAYFLLNGAALLAEHSTTGRRLGLGGGWRGRAFTLGVAAAPVGLLFHPPFVRNVILPFLHAIGAI
jgi:hypothetical protein